MNILQRYWTRRILRNHPIPFSLWHRVTRHLPLIQHRNNREKTRLRLLTTLFLHKKVFSGVRGLEVNDEIRITIAAQACLEILYLGLNAFDGWLEIVVYPGAFIVQRDTADANGIIHNEARGLSGESWQQGPVILSWNDIKHNSHHLHPGHHVVIHEFAHKLDMQSGRANGMPPLHPDMPVEKWSQALSDAYQELRYRLSQHQPGYINSYAATNPAEFFAVLCEYFFTSPYILQQHCPAVFQQLKSYFRQDPSTSTPLPSVIHGHP